MVGLLGEKSAKTILWTWERITVQLQVKRSAGWRENDTGSFKNEMVSWTNFPILCLSCPSRDQLFHLCPRSPIPDQFSHPQTSSSIPRWPLPYFCIQTSSPISGPTFPIITRQPPSILLAPLLYSDQFSNTQTTSLICEGESVCVLPMTQDDWMPVQLCDTKLRKHLLKQPGLRPPSEQYLKLPLSFLQQITSQMTTNHLSLCSYLQNAPALIGHPLSLKMVVSS